MSYAALKIPSGQKDQSSAHISRFNNLRKTKICSLKRQRKFIPYIVHFIAVVPFAGLYWLSNINVRIVLLSHFLGISLYHYNVCLQAKSMYALMTFEIG